MPGGYAVHMYCNPIPSALKCLVVILKNSQIILGLVPLHFSAQSNSVMETHNKTHNLTPKFFKVMPLCSEAGLSVISKTALHLWSHQILNLEDVTGGQSNHISCEEANRPGVSEFFPNHISQVMSKSRLTHRSEAFLLGPLSTACSVSAPSVIRYAVAWRPGMGARVA